MDRKKKKVAEAIPVEDSAPLIAAIAAGPRAPRLCDGLARAGLDRIVSIEWADAAPETISKQDPDVVLIDLGDPDPEIFAATLALIRTLDRPNAVFVDRSDRSRTSAAIDAGVGTYVVDGFKVSRLSTVVDMAIARHAERLRAREAISASQRDRADRAVIDEAKAILMARNKMSERDAYAAMRKTAMNQNRRLVEVARLLIEIAGNQPPSETQT
jgi:response regulator NasT